MDPSPVMIIAMKGHPGTGKSTLAHAIASTLRYPLIDKDDVRDSTCGLSDSSCPADLNELSYQVIRRIAKTQLDLGLSVVVDSPLSRQIHLDHLKEIAAPRGARLLIIECVSRDEAEWRRRVVQRGINDEANWHKPATWQDLKRLIEEYQGCFEYDAGDVPKLVVDTTAKASVEELLSMVLRFIVSHVSITDGLVNDYVADKMLPRDLVMGFCGWSGSAAESKVTKHEKTCTENQHGFTLFAFDMFGFLALEAVVLLRKIQKFVNKNLVTVSSAEYVFRRVDCTIQKEIAVQLVARLPTSKM